MAAGLGFEPRLPGPEPGVLPLDDPAILSGVNTTPQRRVIFTKIRNNSPQIGRRARTELISTIMSKAKTAVILLKVLFSPKDWKSPVLALNPNTNHENYLVSKTSQ